MAKKSKSKSTTLLSSIFDSSSSNNNNTHKTPNNSKDDTKQDPLSNLFNSSSNLPDRPNLIAPVTNSKSSKHKHTNKDTTSNQSNNDVTPKIIKGGKKRMRKKKLELEQQQQPPKQQKQQHDVGEEKVDSSNQSNKETDATTESNDISKETTKDEPITTTISTKDTSNPKESKSNKLTSHQNAQERTIFVGNLPLTISRKELASIFKICGKVESTRLRSVATTGVKLPPQKKGNQKLVRKVCANTNLIDTSIKKTAQGYVVFTDKDSVEKALAMNNTIVTLSGSEETIRLRVDTAEPTIDYTRTVFVGNLPYDAEEESVYRHFSNLPEHETTDADANATTSTETANNKDGKEGIVERVRIIRDPTTMQCKGFGYVLFYHRASVVEGLRLHDSVYQNRTLRVQICGKRYKGKRGQENSHDHPSKNTKSSKFEGMRSTTAAAKRILGKRKKSGSGSGSGSTAEGSGKFIVPQKKRRTYSEKNAAGHIAKSKKTVPGMSKRAATESKIGKRVKKLQKRMAKGMGKAKR